MGLRVTRKFGLVEAVYDSDEDVSFVVELPSGKINIFLPHDETQTNTSVYGVYGVYGAYKSGYSFTSESMVQRKKGKQFITFTPTEKGKHKIKVMGTQEETTITV